MGPATDPNPPYGRQPTAKRSCSRPGGPAAAILLIYVRWWGVAGRLSRVRQMPSRTAVGFKWRCGTLW